MNIPKNRTLTIPGTQRSGFSCFDFWFLHNAGVKPQTVAEQLVVPKCAKHMHNQLWSVGLSAWTTCYVTRHSVGAKRIWPTKYTYRMHTAGRRESTTTETCTARTNNNCHAKRISARRLYRLKLARMKRSCPGWTGTGLYRLAECTKKRCR